MSNLLFIASSAEKQKHMAIIEEETLLTSLGHYSEDLNHLQKFPQNIQIPSVRRKIRALYFLCAVLFILLISTMVWHLQLHAPSVPSKSPRQSCGSTVQEATTLGCTFDLLSRSWLPPDCSRFGNSEFIAGLQSFDENSWGIYADLGQTRALTMDEIAGYAESGLKWFGTERQHRLHCAWLLKRVLDVHGSGRRLDVVTGSWEHTAHCVDTLFMSADGEERLDEISLRGNVRFGIC